MTYKADKICSTMVGQSFTLGSLLYWLPLQVALMRWFQAGIVEVLYSAMYLLLAIMRQGEL